MGLVEEFESALRDVVQGKHLSASRMNKLTEVALKSMENDTQLVSVLYRTHKTLPPKSKISSLYAFDALARAARNKVVKHGVPSDADAGKGNCATFLLKVEGVLDGLFHDMISSGPPEAKEKTKKVLDIWVKSNTFPPAVLARLADIVKEADKEPEIKTDTTPDPRAQSTPNSTTPPTQPPAAHPTPPAVDAVQSTLLALLSQAATAAASPPQIPPNTAAIAAATQVAQLDVNQLALIQQLAQTSQLGTTNAAQSPSVPLSLAPPGPAHAPNAPPSYPFRPPDRDDRREYDRRGPRGDPYNDPRRSHSRDDYHDDRRDLRGGYRGGYRGRGRGRMDDRDRFSRRDRDWRSPPRGRPSRSRSPPGGRYGRDRQPHSPPRKPPLDPSAHHPEPSRLRGPSADLDEFGRDIRPQSSRDPGTASASHDKIDMQLQAKLASVPSSLERSPTLGDNKASQSQPPSYPKGADVGPSKVPLKQKGLDDYDFSAFDPTSPAAWEALGSAWQVTHGYQPSAEEIMQLVMAKTMPAMAPMGGQIGMAQGEQWGSIGWQQYPAESGVAGSWSTSTGAQVPSSNGGRSYGNVREENVASEQNKDTLEAGEVSEEQPMSSTESAGLAGDNSVGGQGRMQKVGDRWVFVKG